MGLHLFERTQESFQGGGDCDAGSREALVSECFQPGRSSGNQSFSSSDQFSCNSDLTAQSARGGCQPYYQNDMATGSGAARGFMGGGGGGMARGLGGAMLGGLITGAMFGGGRGFGGGMAMGLLGGGLFRGLFGGGGILGRIFSRFGGGSGGGGGGCDDGSCDGGGNYDDGGSDGNSDGGGGGSDGTDNYNERQEQNNRRRRRDLEQEEHDQQNQSSRRRNEDAERVVDQVKGVSVEDKQLAKTPTKFEEETLRLINDKRAATGDPNVKPLEFDPRLQLAALQHSKYQNEHGLTHQEDREGWESPSQRLANVGLKGWRENAALGNISAQQLVDLWFESPPHRAALLARGTTKAGISKYGKGSTFNTV